MSKKRVAMIIATKAKQERRREEVAYLLLEGYSISEIAEYSIYSERTIERDVEYIKSHLREFYS